MKKSIGLLQKMVDSSKELVEERAYEVCHSPEDYDWLKRYMQECIAYLDYSERLSKLKGEDFEGSSKSLYHKKNN